jgi:hypothetical protein
MKAALSLSGPSAAHGVVMANAQLTLSLSADLPETRLAQLTRDLGRDLSREGIAARPAEAPAVSGERGEPITLGMLILALVTTGAVNALIGCLKAYISREPALNIKLKRSDGIQIEVNARNVDAPDVYAALKKASSVS